MCVAVHHQATRTRCGGSNSCVFRLPCCLAQLVVSCQVDSLVKLFLTSVLTFVSADQQMTAGLVVTALYLITIQLAAPYLRARDDRLSQLVQTEIILLLLTGQLISQQGAPEAGSAVDV